MLSATNFLFRLVHALCFAFCLCFVFCVLFCFLCYVYVLRCAFSFCFCFVLRSLAPIVYSHIKQCVVSRITNEQRKWRHHVCTEVHLSRKRRIYSYSSASDDSVYLITLNLAPPNFFYTHFFVVHFPQTHNTNTSAHTSQTQAHNTSTSAHTITNSSCAPLVLLSCSSCVPPVLRRFSCSSLACSPLVLL